MTVRVEETVAVNVTVMVSVSSTMGMAEVKGMIEVRVGVTVTVMAMVVVTVTVTGTVIVVALILPSGGVRSSGSTEWRMAEASDVNEPTDEGVGNIADENWMPMVDRASADASTGGREVDVVERPDDDCSMVDTANRIAEGKTGTVVARDRKSESDVNTGAVDAVSKPTDGDFDSYVTMDIVSDRNVETTQLIGDQKPTSAQFLCSTKRW